MIIEAHQLTKRYGRSSVVDDVSIGVAQGEVYGFLGLNGAGKTTTIRMLLNMISPSTGSVRLFGRSLAQVNWNDVGYLVETPHAYPNLSVRENLKVIAWLRKLPNTAIDSILSKLNLDRFSNTAFKNLSLGNQQRLGLAKALIHEPQLLILDEPINGLDPAGIVEVRELLKQMSHAGTTIFLSSHILSEVAKLATRIGVIHEGRLVSEFKTRQIHQHLERKLILQTLDNPRAMELLKRAGYHPSLVGERIELADENALESPQDIATLLVNERNPPVHLQVHEEDLESLFLRMIAT